MTAVLDPAEVLAKALRNAGDALGVPMERLAEAIGRNRSSIHRTGISPDTKAGELALLVVRIYRGLYALVGGDKDAMHHWMHTRNHHTGGVPAEQLASVQGLVEVLQYLDAIRAKV